MQHKILGVIFASAIAGAAYSQTQSEPPAHPFATLFQPYVDDHTIPGAVFLVANRDAILDEEAVGYADLESHRPMATNQEFWIASMTKPFTATLLMMLVDEGKLSIDDPVEKYLPEFKGLMVKTAKGLVPPDHPILIREILSHTSGMTNMHGEYTAPLAEQVAEYAKTPLDNQPGTKFTYVNAGLNTVGRIVEVVSGKPYEVFLQERLLTPLGMKDTTFWPNAEQLARLATAYKANAKGDGLVKAPNPLTPNPGKLMKAFPAGGLFSTAEDLLKFCRMLLEGGTYEGHTYISQAAIDTMTKTYTTAQTGGSYGLGWMTSSNSFFHDGAFKTRMTIEPRNGLVEIFMVQLENPLAKNGSQMVRLFSHSADAIFGASLDAVSVHSGAVEPHLER